MEEQHPLVGQCVKSERSFTLDGCLVDGQVYFSGDFFMPRIYKGDKFYVKSVDSDVVTLKNLTREEWSECELEMVDVEEFKVISKSEI